MLTMLTRLLVSGAVLYIKKEFSLESQPLIEGLIVATSLIGATVITMFSGAVADSVGRRRSESVV